MSDFENIYEPAEDSFILSEISIEEIKKLKKHNLDILEVGVGSGYSILNIAKEYPKNNFYGSDINKFAIDYTHKQFRKNKQKITLKNSPLITGFKKNFDIILFNTPYLPCENGDNYQDLTIKDKAIYGGDKGYEVIEEFIYQINDKLKYDGFVLMVFSSYSNLKYIEDVLKNNFFEFEIVKQELHFFEKLYCMKIKKSKILKQLSKKDLREIKSFSHGKHSKVLEAKLNKKNVIVKIGEEQYIQKEKIYLQKLQKSGFVPKLYFYEKNFVVMEKLQKEVISDFLANSSKKDTLKVMQNLLDICYKLDKSNIQKFELTNPRKHIFVDKKLNCKFIDFERSIISFTPKNTTQILEYLKRNSNILKNKGIKLSKDKIFEISKKYKKDNFVIKVEDLI